MCSRLMQYTFLSALFMFRDPGFLDRVPAECQELFMDNQEIAPYKLQILKKMVQDRFPVSTLKCIYNEMIVIES